MIEFQEQVLPNGLRLITHEDHSTPLAVVNTLYRVGSRNEDPERTGFAHLFEHLMFGGSKHVPDYDQVLQQIGAENNAFTNTDITNYYVILGAQNIETALWAEADRMRYLNLDQNNLENQQSVVIEEFKQRYLEVPYGDVWLKLRPLAYQAHPYQWATIGKKPEHVEDATLDDVRDFHDKYYCPDNAILCVSGNINTSRVVDLVNKWFGDIPMGNSRDNIIQPEPKQTEARHLDVEASVPLSALYKAYHMPARGDQKYYATDLVSDILGRGKSSRLHQELVKKKKIFNDIHAYVLGTSHPGLLIISGKVNAGMDIKEADRYVQEQIDLVKDELPEEEIGKVKNQAASSSYFSESELLNRSIGLAIAADIGNTNLVNEEVEIMMGAEKNELLKATNDVLAPANCSTLYYRNRS